jgi:hypothetical protein
VSRGVSWPGQRISRFILKADQDIFYLHRKQLLADRSAAGLRNAHGGA